MDHKNTLMKTAKRLLYTLILGIILGMISYILYQIGFDIQLIAMIGLISFFIIIYLLVRIPSKK